jgi:hypothetical protein
MDLTSSWNQKVLKQADFPRFQESCHPSDLNTRGLEAMTNALLQRGR